MIEVIDHCVLTVRDIDRAAAVYARVLGLRVAAFADTCTALNVGNQKINLQTLGQEPRNHACIGSGDLCLLTKHAPKAVAERLTAQGVAILEGPVSKTGASDPIISIYLNDLDGTLVEVSSYAEHTI